MKRSVLLKIFFVFGVVLASVFSLMLWQASKQSGLERSSSETVIEVTSSLGKEWDAGVLVERASARMLEQNEPQVLLDYYRHLQRHGELLSIDSMDGTLHIPPLWQLGQVPTAHYVLMLSFRWGTARVETGLSYRDGQWEIDHYYLFSSQRTL